MTIAAENLDADVAAALRKATKKKPLPLKKHGAASPLIALQSLLFTVSILFLGMGLFLGVSGATTGWAIAFAALLAVFVVLSFEEERIQYEVEELAVLLPVAKLSGAEKDYLGALIILLHDSLPMEPLARHRTTELAHGLLKDLRGLKAARKRLEATIKEEEGDDLQNEVRRLQKEALKAEDATIRESKLQTLRMVEQRRHELEAWHQMVPRLEAQEEAVAQTLATLRFSLLRLSTTPLVASATSGLGEEIETIVADVTRLTRALEQSVQEVQEVLTVRRL